jgi:hypothetical protein
VSDFDDIVNGAFSSLAQSPAGQIVGNSYAAHAIRNMLGLARTPGDVAKGISPAQPGVMDEDYARRLNEADTRWQDQAHAGALNLLGYGAQFAPSSALGMGGGKVMTPEHAASALADIHSGKTLLQGVKNALGLGEKTESGLSTFDPAKWQEENKGLPYNEYMQKKVSLPIDDWKALHAHEDKQFEANYGPLPSLSDKSITHQLEENPGASIEDIAGVPSTPKGTASTTPSAPPEFGVSSQKFVQDAGSRAPESAWGDYDSAHEDFVKNGGYKHIPPIEQESVGHWSTPEGYKEINAGLRKPKEVSTETEGHINNLDTAINYQATKGPMTVWRGVNGPQRELLSNLSLEDSFHNAGYTATTLDPRRATHYGGKQEPGALIAFHLPEGTKGLYTSHPSAGAWSEAEREMLLPHGQQFKIIGREDIQAPRWHYSGDVTNSEMQNYKVYHVEPSSGGKSTQLDLMPGAPFIGPKWVPNEPKALPATPQYHGYSILKHVGAEGKLNVYDPGGANIGNIYKMGGDSYHLNLKDDPEGNIAAAQHDSIGSALEEAARAHKQITGSESNRYAKYIEPLDWSKMVSPIGAKAAIPGEALPRAAGQGYNALYPLYKGTQNVTDYPEKLGTTLLSGKKQWEKGLFFADNPDIAGGYGKPLEYVARAEKPMQVDWVKATGTGEYDTTLMHHLIEGARSKGADLLHIRNLEDVDKHQNTVLQNQIVALNPSVVRAPQAKFNPARIKENVPLAGIAALGATPLMFDKKGNLLIHLGDKESSDGTGKE